MTEDSFLAANPSFAPGQWVLLGAPLDLTASYRRGSSGGPGAIRTASDCIEEYCPRLEADLSQRPFADLGDVDLAQPIELPLALTRIEEAVQGVLEGEGRPLLLGGEHTVTLGAVRCLHDRFPDLAVVQFDAHADLREDYDSEPLSHACVMRRLLDFLPAPALFQVGVRSGTSREYAFMRKMGTLYQPTAESLATIRERVGRRPIYITVDLDVLDPSTFPGTGSPEPGGISFVQLQEFLVGMGGLNVVGADVVETAPSLDPSGISPVVASKIVRTMLLSL